MAHFFMTTSMDRITVIIISFFLYGHLTGQNDTVFIKYNRDRHDENIYYRTDTLVFDTPNARQILYGTTVLPWTVNQQFAKNFGLYLDTVAHTTCKKENDSGPKELTVITNVLEKTGKLQIEIKYWGNCCHAFLCDVEVIENTTINLIVYGYGATYCSCTCCYGLNFSFSTLDVPEYKGLTSVMINGDKKTLKKMR
jgi:hypothetical protein